MDKIVETIKEKLEETIDTKVSILELNNKSSIMIHSKNNSHALILSMEKYINAYKRGENIENIIKKIVTIYVEENKNIIESKNINEKKNYIKESTNNEEQGKMVNINDPEIKETLEKEYLLDNVFFAVISLKKNREYLEDKFFVDILKDIAVILKVPIKGSIDVHITLSKYSIEILDVDIDELIKRAIINTSNKVHIYKLEDLELKHLGLKVNPIEIDEEFESEELYTICSDNNLFASGILTCREYLDNLCLNNPNGIGIIPSSIHELIIFKMDDSVDIEQTKSMICKVNNDPNCINEKTFLSNNLFYYSPEDGLQIVD